MTRILLFTALMGIFSCTAFGQILAVITTQPDDDFVCFGNPASFTVTIQNTSGTFFDYYIRWEYNTAQGSGTWVPVQSFVGHLNSNDTVLTLPNLATYTSLPFTVLPTSPFYFCTAPFRAVILDPNGGVIATSNLVRMQCLSGPTVDAGPDVTICQGDNVSIGGSPTASGGLTPYTYRWTPSAGLNNVSAANPVASPSVTTNYIVVATDANGCTGRDTVQVSVIAPPTISPSSNSPVCEGDTLRLFATSGFQSYAWVGPGGFSSVAQNPVRPNATFLFDGIYSLMVTDANGCTSSGLVTVTVNGLPSVTASSNSPVCDGGTIALSATGIGLTYSWAGPLSFSSTLQNPTRTNAMSGFGGRYVVQATDINGCTGTDTATVVINPPLIADAGPNQAICAGGSTTLGGSPTAMGGTPPYTYVWTPGGSLSNPTAANPIASPLMTQPYTVTVTDVNACTSSASTTVSITTQPVTSLSFTENSGLVSDDGIICEGDQVMLLADAGPAAGTAGLVFEFFENGFSVQTGPLDTYAGIPSANANYSVTISAGTCSDSDGPVSITVNPTPLLNPFIPVTACDGDTLQLTANPVGGTPPFQFNWAGPTGFSSQMENPFIASVAASNAGVYTVAIEDVNGCLDVSSGAVAVVPSPLIVPSSNGPVCEGDTLALLANPSGGTPPYSFSWEFAGNSRATENIFVFPSDPDYPGAGTTSFMLTALDANGCDAQASSDMTIDPLPLANAVGPFMVCEETLGGATAIFDLTSLEADITAGNSQQVQVDWVNEFGNPIGNPAAYQSDTRMVMAIVSVQNTATMCSDMTTVALEVTSLPQADFEAPSVCKGTPTAFENLSASGNSLSINWDFGDGNTSTDTMPAYTYAEANDYRVTLVVSSPGCADTATKNVTVRPVPEAIGTISEPCYSQASEFDASASKSNDQDPGPDPANLSFTWYFLDAGDTLTITDPVHSYTFQSRVSGLPVRLTVENSEGCTNEATLGALLDICGPPAPFVDKVYKDGESGVLLLSRLDGVTAEQVTFQWYDPNGDPVVNKGDRPFLFLEDASSADGYSLGLSLVDGSCACETRSLRVAQPPVTLAPGRGLVASPNPNTGTFALDLDHPATGAVQIEIWDRLGRRAFDRTTAKEETRFHQLIQTALPSGIYAVRFKVGEDFFFHTQVLIR